jgi:hypothetical protein
LLFLSAEGKLVLGLMRILLLSSAAYFKLFVLLICQKQSRPHKIVEEQCYSPGKILQF